MNRLWRYGVTSGQFKVADERGGGMNNLEIEQGDKFFSQKTTWTKKFRVCFLVVKYLERM